MENIENIENIYIYIYIYNYGNSWSLAEYWGSMWWMDCWERLTPHPCEPWPIPTRARSYSVVVQLWSNRRPTLRGGRQPWMDKSTWPTAKKWPQRVTPNNGTYKWSKHPSLWKFPKCPKSIFEYSPKVICCTFAVWLRGFTSILKRKYQKQFGLHFWWCLKECGKMRLTNVL